MEQDIKLIDCHETASLSKFWYKIDGENYLVKGNHAGNTEPIMEVLSANLLDVLDYTHAEYEIGLMNDFPEIVPADGHRLVSISKALPEIEGCTRMSLFSIMVEHAYTSGRNLDSITNEYAITMLKLMKEKDRFEFLKQLHFDAIVGNTDRHFNNIEYYVYDNIQNWTDDLGIKCIVPVYDVGSTLLHEEDEHSYKIDDAKPFRCTHEAQIKFIQDTFDYSHSFGNPKEIYKRWYESSSPVMDKCISNERKLRVCNYLKRRLELYATI